MKELRYVHFGRGFGHTQAMLNGAKNADNVVIVAHTQRFADYLAEQCKNARGVGLDRTERLRGLHLPILVDHYAVEFMLGESESHITHLEGLLAEAGTQIVYLHEKFQETGSGNAVLGKIYSYLRGKC